MHDEPGHHEGTTGDPRWPQHAAAPPTAQPYTPPAPPPHLYAPPAYCRACGTQIDARAVVCPSCGVGQGPPPPAYGYAPQPYAPPAATRKDPALAMLLSFLWPGIGHLYVGDNDVGIPLTVISGINGLLSFTLIWLVVGVPIWLGTAIYTMVDSNKKANLHNGRLGLR